MIQVELKKLEDNSDHALLHVSILDNGVGIHPEDKKYLFQTFRKFRCETRSESANDETSSIGWGLSTSKILLEAQGGSISLHSELGSFTQVELNITVKYKSKNMPIDENGGDDFRLDHRLFVCDGSELSYSSGSLRDDDINNLFGGLVVEEFVGRFKPLQAFPERKRATTVKKPNVSMAREHLLDFTSEQEQSKPPLSAHNIPDQDDQII